MSTHINYQKNKEEKSRILVFLAPEDQPFLLINKINKIKYVFKDTYMQYGNKLHVYLQSLYVKKSKAVLLSTWYHKMKAYQE